MHGKKEIGTEIESITKVKDELVSRIEKQKDEIQSLTLSNREFQIFSRNVEEQIKSRQKIKEKKVFYEEEKRKLHNELERKKEEIEQQEKSVFLEKLARLKEERTRFDEESSAQHKKIAVEYEKERKKKVSIHWLTFVFFEVMVRMRKLRILTTLCCRLKTNLQAQ